MRNRLKKLERVATRGYIFIPQQDGTVATFPPRAAADGLTNLVARRGAGADAPAEHPILLAARNSSDAWWRNSFYSEIVDPYEVVEDLSE